MTGKATKNVAAKAFEALESAAGPGGALKSDRDGETTKEVGDKKRKKPNRRISVAPMMDWTDGR